VAIIGRLIRGGELIRFLLVLVDWPR